MSSESTWEQRMGQRAKARALAERQAALSARLGLFTRWVRDTDPDEILLEVIAARCLGIEYGDPGPVLPETYCRECWGERYVWLGNCWGIDPVCGGLGRCKHWCHAGEIWMAGNGEKTNGTIYL